YVNLEHFVVGPPITDHRHGGLHAEQLERDSFIAEFSIDRAFNRTGNTQPFRPDRLRGLVGTHVAPLFQVLRGSRPSVLVARAGGALGSRNRVGVTLGVSRDEPE